MLVDIKTYDFFRVSENNTGLSHGTDYGIEHASADGFR
jgi:hypothetical protein